jgi:hypothetical protein
MTARHSASAAERFCFFDFAADEVALLIEVGAR